MTLEDFFTLSELKYGLTSPERVNELITIMHKENDSIIKNLGEATRVATTIAATENKNCLDLFIHLNGTHFIDLWLNAAQKLGNDTRNGFLEEPIIALLKAIERLPIDHEKSSVSEIGKTVQNLVAHSSSVVRNRAKMLCDRWGVILENDVKSEDEKNVERPKDETIPMVNNEETVKTDKITDRETLGCVEVKETCGSTDVKDENEINCCFKPDLVEMSTLCSHLEQIASSLDSSRKTDPIGDEDEDMVDNGESSEAEALRDPREAESLKMSSNSESGNAKENVGNSGNDSGFFEISGGGSEPPNTPDSTNHKESPPVDRSDKTEQKKDDAETIVSERVSCKADITASQVSEIAHESEADTERGISGFDLNQEVCSEEVDNPINPVSVVSASGSPSAPLQFEGALNWKGSASTSAFRPITDSTRPHNNSNQRLDRLDFDLNVGEDSEDKIDDYVSGLPSGEESCVEASPRRPERMQLDLNSIGDENADDDVGLDWGRDKRVAPVKQNGWQSPSRSSSSSSKQPSLRNIDLNLKSSNHEESVVSIFGTKVEVKVKDFLPQPPVDFNLGRPVAGLGYGYPHNNFAPGAAMFFYGSPGGSIPYMGSSQPLLPFMMNMAVAGSSSGSTGAGPSFHNFDLNMGLTIDGGNRETVGGLRQLFHNNGGSSMDEQYLRANGSFQASSSFVVGGKRREPDAARLELFPVNKHAQPPPQPPWR